MSKTSIDEMIASRKSAMSGDVLMKAVKAPPTWNESARSARFIMTSEGIDRDGDYVVVDGIDLTEFEKNPISLWAHERDEPIGTWANFTKEGRPKRLEGDHIFAKEGIDETADRIARLVGAGIVRACSIGYRPDWSEAEAITDDQKRFTGIQFNKITLWECSIVSLPANQRALAKIADERDRKYATQILTEVLDNWIKTPAGLFMTKAEYEESLKIAENNKTVHTIGDIEDGLSKSEGFLTKLRNLLLTKQDVSSEPAPHQEESPRSVTVEEKLAAQSRAEAALHRAGSILAHGA